MSNSSFSCKTVVPYPRKNFSPGPLLFYPDKKDNLQYTFNKICPQNCLSNKHLSWTLPTCSPAAGGKPGCNMPRVLSILAIGSTHAGVSKHMQKKRVTEWNTPTLSLSTTNSRSCHLSNVSSHQGQTVGLASAFYLMASPAILFLKAVSAQSSRIVLSTNSRLLPTCQAFHISNAF